MTILEKIDQLRLARGWSINYLAMEAMLTQSTLNNLYSRNAEPKISTLRSICGAFNITLSEFFRQCDGESEDTVDERLRAKISTMTDDEKQALLTVLSLKN
ncbi:MAG: helix-turn-helix domain-containing protein [Roseburia sp.]|nr:helix-turn-helix domain-containing protein [Roseburia sp.]